MATPATPPADPRALPTLAALLAGQAAGDIARDDDAAWQSLLQAGRFHGVLPLVHAGWMDANLRQATSPLFADGCAAEARRVAAMDLAQRQAIAQVLPVIAAAGGEPVLLKGSALAWTHYAAPSLRPRADIDVLIAPASRAAVARALADAGLAAALQLPGEYVSSQATWTPATAGGSTQSFDLHWRINNAPVLARLLDHAEIAASALPLPALGPAARAPSSPHAVLIAALHRVGSRDSPYHAAGWSLAGGDRLIWLMDFLMLARGLDDAGRSATQALLATKGARALLSDAIAVLRALRPAWADEAAALLPSGSASDPRLDAYMAAAPARRRWLDFIALGNWAARVGYLAEQGFPPAAYLRARDPAHAHWPRPLLAARRLLARSGE
jgi:hypothetical protein